MKVQLILSRGISISINGQDPGEGWTYGQEVKEDCTIIHFTNLKIGGTLLETLELGWPEDGETLPQPKMSGKLKTEDGEYDLVLTSVVETLEGSEEVPWGDGHRTIDETALWLEFEG